MKETIKKLIRKTVPLKRRVVLHIGMHKTGTTSLQKTLGSNREKLLRSDIYYPEIQPFNHSARFTPIFMENPMEFVIFGQRGIVEKKDVYAERDRLLKQWEQEFNRFKGGTFLISGEELSKLSELDVGNLKKLLDTHFHEIEIIIYVREPASFFPSVLSEYVKHGGRRIDFDDYSKRFPLYRSRIEPYVNVFGRDRLIVRRFDSAYLKDGDLFADFFSVLGLDFDVNQLVQTSANPSLCHDTIMFLLAYNKAFPRYKKGKINTERGLPFKLDAFYNVIRRVEGESFHFKPVYSDEDSKRINEEIEYVNTFLEESEQFSRLVPSVHSSEVFDPLQEISPEYFPKLINEYNKRIESLMEEIETLRNCKSAS